MRLLVFTLIAMSMCYRVIQHEQGLDTSVSFNTGHILEKQQGIPRTIESIVKFKKEFAVIPQVSLAVNVLDWAAGLPCGYRVEAVDITTTQFKLRISAVAALPLYTVHTNWFAVFDPRIQIFHFETTDIAPLKTGNGERAVQLNLGINFPEATTGVVFLTGVRHITTNPIVELTILKIQPKLVTVQVKTYWEAQLDMIRFCVIIGTDQSLWASNQQRFYFAPGSNNAFAKRDPGQASVIGKIELPKIWQSGPRVALVGYSGYDDERTRNFRLRFGLVKLEQNLEIEIVTWWDTFMYGVYYFGAIYAPDSNIRIFDPDCSEIFSECGFKGDSITVCDRISDLPQQGWSKPVKSLTVPKGRVLRLFNKDKFQGQQSAFNENKECLESVSFSFAELSQKVTMAFQQ